METAAHTGGGNSDSAESDNTAAAAALHPSSEHSAHSDAGQSLPLPTKAGSNGQAAIATSLPPLPERTRRHAKYPLVQTIKRLLPCVLNILIGSIFVVNKQIANLSGTADYAFLIIVIYTLFFHPAGHTVGKHIQITVSSIIGAVVGVGWSALAYELACLANRRAGVEYGATSVGARASCACCLACIAFVGALVRSRYPRMASGCLLSVFTSIWLLAVTTTDTQITAAPFLGMLYPALFAAGISLVVISVIFPQSASKRIAQNIIDSLDVMSELLLATLHLHQTDTALLSNFQQSRLLQTRIVELRDTLLKQVAQLRPTYEEAQFEITFAHLPLNSYEAFIDLSLKLQILLTSRMIGKASYVETIYNNSNDGGTVQGTESEGKPLYLRSLVNDLGKMNLQAINSMRGVIANSALLPSIQSLVLGQPSSVTAIGARLEDIITAFRAGAVEALQITLANPVSKEYRQQPLFGDEAFKDYFFFTSLVEFSREVQRGLDLAAIVQQQVHGQRRKLWFPALSVLFTSSRGLSSDELEDGGPVGKDEDDEAIEHEERAHRAAAGLNMWNAHQLPFLQLQRPRKPLRRRLTSASFYWDFWRAKGLALKRWWSSSRIMSRRLKMHLAVTTAVHSRHLKHAVKTALGISLLTLPGHLAAETRGYRWFVDARGPWIAIAFLYCLQGSTAATYRDAVFRTCGTFLGAVYGLVGQTIARGNPYALVAVMTFQAFFTNYLIVDHPRYRGIGIVAQLTVPSILFVPYLGLNYDTAAKLAFVRAQDIEIGIVAALIINNLLWPYHARVQLLTACAKATDKLTKLYLSMSRQILKRDNGLTEDTAALYSQLEDSTRSALARASALCDIVHVETSLLPKPVKKYRRLIESLSQLLNLYSGLRAIRQNIPRKLTVLDVLPHRTELVSSILIVLYSISHSLHADAPVPQFLPQPQNALASLTAAIEEQITEIAVSSPSQATFFSTSKDKQSHSKAASDASSKIPFPSLAGEIKFKAHEPERRDKIDFSFAFALAENEAISEVVSTLSDIIETCKDLYGVASFIQEEEVLHFSHVNSLVPTPAMTPTIRSVMQSFASSMHANQDSHTAGIPAARHPSQ